MRGRRPQRSLPSGSRPGRIAYFGESLGAAVAGGLASRRPPAALILRSPPPSMVEMARHHYPYLPVIPPLLMDRYPLAEQMRGIEVPTLVIVTERDEVVPADLSRRVYEAAAGARSAWSCSMRPTTTTRYSLARSSSPRSLHFWTSTHSSQPGIVP